MDPTTITTIYLIALSLITGVGLYLIGPVIVEALRALSAPTDDIDELARHDRRRQS